MPALAPSSLPVERTTRRVVIRLDEVPSAWQRAQPVARWKRKGTVHTSTPCHKAVSVSKVTPPATRAAQVRIARGAALAARGVRFTTACRVTITAVFSRPQRLAKSAPGRHHHMVRPDIDNVAKNILDGLQRDAMGGRPAKRPATGWPGVIADDKLVVELVVRKYYAAMGEQPHVTIEIEDI